MSVSSIASSTPSILTAATATRPTDGDTPAQEAAESALVKLAEAANGGFARNSAGLVNKTA